MIDGKYHDRSVSACQWQCIGLPANCDNGPVNGLLLNILQETRYSNCKIMYPATVRCFCGVRLYKKEESGPDDTIRS